MIATAAALALVFAAEVPLARRAEDPVGWWKGDVFYEVFVRSFADSDGDGHGDLRGLVAKLPVLEALGVDGLWLMPIYAGPTDHGYAVADYDAIDPRYGTMEDARALLDEAHARGMAVLLDFVPNHVSREHPWFRAALDGDRLAQDHFVFRDAAPVGWASPWDRNDEKKPVWSEIPELKLWYYHAFDPSMPDLDLADRPTRAAMLATARRWLDRGADGFRVDAVRYLYEAGPKLQADLPESVRFLADLTDVLTDGGGFVAAEVWADTPIAARYLGASHAVFDFDRAYALYRALDEEKAAGLEAAVIAAERATPPGAAFAAFATNHDAPLRRAGSFGPEAAALSAALVLASGGVPFLWQGDELGLRAIDEHQMRRPMRWTPAEDAGFGSEEPWRESGERFPGDDVESQRADPSSVWRRVQALLQVRRASAALRFGVRYPVRASPAGVWSFVRHDGTERVLVVANLGEAPVRKASLDLRGLPLPAKVTLTPLHGATAPLAIAGGRAELALAGRGIAFFAVPRDPRAFRVRFAAAGVPPGPEEAIDQGLRFHPARGLGFSRDLSRNLSCKKRGRCGITLPPRGEIEWTALVPPGAYDVEIELAARAAPGALSVEGDPMTARGARLSRRVLARDGRLSIRSSGAAQLTLTGVRVRPAPVRPAKIDVKAAPDRVVITAPVSGTVEWRMDRSSAEPPERTPLTRDGARFTATLGPWRPGAVREIALVVRTSKDELLGAEPGPEIVLSVP